IFPSRTIIYSAPNTGNEVTLSNQFFDCDNSSGEWIAKDMRKVPFTIQDNATLSCVMKEKSGSSSLRRFRSLLRPHRRIRPPTHCCSHHRQFLHPQIQEEEGSKEEGDG
ncbi:hypothetical protein PMAYCL1PPCAC_24716, partial [Pristionchus mayeri]